MTNNSRKININEIIIDEIELSKILIEKYNWKIKLPVVQVCKICNTTFIHKRKTIVKCCSEHCRNVYLKRADIIEKKKSSIKKTFMEKYGVEHYSLLPEFAIKMKKTKKERYGHEGYVNSEKAKATKKEKYNNENYNGREKSQQDEFDSIKEKLHYFNIDILEPLTSFNYIENGIKHYKKFRFKCILCSTEFYTWLANGHIPICELCYPPEKIGQKVQNEIYEFLSSVYTGKILLNDRIQISPLELDFYIPDINLAIEFDGIYWHSEANGKDRLYHINKTNLCNKKGIDLIHIFETEWINNKNIIKSIINSKLGLIENVIYARNCYVIELDVETKNNFLQINHIQGKDISSIRLGLINNDEIVSVMTFSKARYNKNIEYEIVRFANKLNTRILGAASKLFSYFVKKYNPCSVISYSDIRYFNGKLYERLGFEFKENTQPNYFYFNYKNDFVLKSRLQFQKHKLPAILDKFDKNLSEWENMKLNGYNRIWDCGNKKYVKYFNTETT